LIDFLRKESVNKANNKPKRFSDIVEEESVRLCDLKKKEEPKRFSDFQSKEEPKRLSDITMQEEPKRLCDLK
jgi:hypothetical protein